MTSDSGIRATSRWFLSGRFAEFPEPSQSELNGVTRRALNKPSIATSSSPLTFPRVRDFAWVSSNNDEEFNELFSGELDRVVDKALQRPPFSPFPSRPLAWGSSSEKAEARLEEF